MTCFYSAAAPRGSDRIPSWPWKSQLAQQAKSFCNRPPACSTSIVVRRKGPIGGSEYTFGRMDETEVEVRRMSLPSGLRRDCRVVAK
jgi:hypothetical protein